MFDNNYSKNNINENDDLYFEGNDLYYDDEYFIEDEFYVENYGDEKRSEIRLIKSNKRKLIKQQKLIIKIYDDMKNNGSSIDTLKKKFEKLKQFCVEYRETLNELNNMNDKHRLIFESYKKDLYETTEKRMFTVKKNIKKDIKKNIREYEKEIYFYEKYMFNFELEEEMNKLNNFLLYIKNIKFDNHKVDIKVYKSDKRG